MSDDLEKLLLDVRKIIEDNREFISNLAKDTDQEPERVISSEEQKNEESDPTGDGEEFEEL
jgi:hypothetical protein